MTMIYFAEDGVESWHKLYRLNMTKHARKNTRLNRILDVYNRAIFMRDPKVSLVSGRTKTSDNKLKTTKVDISQFIETG